ncbi:junction-mediating and -regulatory protein isoform X2 [Opisthocomus hoazin]|uniref:junction-mediating and -regulatory protein isoform X2 n=1 Tax=Opisthocomus hoazin TaxID=30419 RepID=UPI003F52C37F
MSAFALEETLEADWVAVRPHAFQEREKHKFAFIVAWNEIEGKFAITCHNRTAQRQRSGSRELRRLGGGPAGPHARAAPAKVGSPAVRSDAGPARGSSAGPRSPLRARSSSARRPPRGAEAAGAGEEIEVLELGKEEAGAALSLPPSPPRAAEPAAPDAEPAGEECSWAGLFSFQDLRAVHQQLCSVNSELEPYLPGFPEEPSGMWSVLFGAPELSEQEMDALCYKLQVYLVHSLDTCGWKILSQVLFTETDDPEEYYESLSELRQKGYEEVLQRARKRIQELLEKHKNTESMVELLELYQMEDEAYSSLAEATTELYQYLLQPFRDMRELAMLRRQQIKMQSLKGGTEAIAHLDQLEADYYDLQLQLYEVQFEILKCEELLLTAQLESIRRLMSEKRDEVVYYDTYESMEAMLEKEDAATSIHLQREELQKLQQKIRQLEARRGRISAKKAYLRNKKEICIAKHSEKIQQHHQSEEEYKMHHTVQLKRDQLQDEEERKSSWVSQERQKTLDRLRTFKQRYPGQVILKSTRLRLAHARRKCAASSVSCADQPQSLPATIQMQERSEEVELENAIQPLQVQESTSLEQLQDISLPLSGVTSELPHISTSPLTSNELQPETVTVVPLPPPLPPPPPPLPSKEDATKSLEKSDSFVKRQSEEKGVQHSSGVPPAHLFDSSQLVSAKKKLKKTGDLEGLQRRRVSSPMDEVLASLKRGSFHLRKVEQRSLPPFPDEDDSNNILAQIRKGVKLKKVQKDVLRESFTILPDTDPLTRSIHEALRRIKEASPESEDEEESLPCTDWEN